MRLGFSRGRDQPSLAASRTGHFTNCGSSLWLDRLNVGLSYAARRISYSSLTLLIIRRLLSDDVRKSPERSDFTDGLVIYDQELD